MNIKNIIVSFARKLCGTERINTKIDDLARSVAKNFEEVQQIREAYSRIDMQSSDILQLLIKNNPFPRFSVVADAKIASDTTDHLYPRGTKNDNTRSPRFVYACEKFFGSTRAQLDCLDIGCAEGG